MQLYSEFDAQESVTGTVGAVSGKDWDRIYGRLQAKVLSAQRVKVKKRPYTGY